VTGPGAAADGPTRHQGRERALSLLYEAEMKGIPPTDVLAGLPVPPDPFTVSLVTAATDRRVEADALVSEASVGWPLERMAVVDRLILRLATAELLDPAGPPTAVVIDEAVELAKTYSTDDSGRFVNGVLSGVAGSLDGGSTGPHGRPDAPPEPDAAPEPDDALDADAGDPGHHP